MNAVSCLAVVAILAAGGGQSSGQTSSAVDITLLQFASQRCQHCQSMQPIVAQLAQQGAKVQVVDVDQQPEVARQFKIVGVPTFVAVRGGREAGRIEGVTNYEKLAALTQGTGDGGQGTTALDRTASSRTSEPQAPSPLNPEQAARAATVRIKVEDATGYGFGTGTIIDTHDNEALVITCGHLFRESKGQGKVTADLFAGGAAQTVEGQLIAYDLDRDVALISLRATGVVRAVLVGPPACLVRPGDRVFTIGCDKGADPSVRVTHITAVNKYKGRPNYTAAGQPIDGRSGGGLFTAEGHLIGICNAADPADNEGLYAGLASIHWQLDQIGQAEIYQRAARVAATGAPRETAEALASTQTAMPPALPVPQLPATMPATQQTSGSGDYAPVAAAGEDTEIVFIVRSKRNPSQQSDVYVVDQAPPDLIARITHAARTSGEQRAAMARANQSAARTAAANPRPGSAPVVRGQSTEY